MLRHAVGCVQSERGRRARTLSPRVNAKFSTTKPKKPRAPRKKEGPELF